MCISSEFSNTIRQTLTHILMAVSILFFFTGDSIASNKLPNKTGSMLLVLEDCDSDNKFSTPPHGDVVSA